MHNLLLGILEKTKKDLLKKNKKSDRFMSALKKVKNKSALIAEVKFASPTSPHLGSSNQLVKRVKEYQRAGANAISIVTEKHVFKGDISYVSKIKKVVDLPVLQKDFIVDVYQIHEARNVGADALLLIARIVTKQELARFVSLCLSFGIEPVVEINNMSDLIKARATQTRIIAVNARDLSTLKVDINKACNLLKKVPKRFMKLGFSGVSSQKEVGQYRKAGAQGILVGTNLMKATNIKNYIQELMV